MRFLKKFSIRSKLLIILLTLNLTSLIIGFTFVISHDIRIFRKDLVENGITIARVIGDYSVVDLTFQDAKASKETLAKLNSIEHVDCAFLYDSQGHLFSSYAKSECKPRKTSAIPIEFQKTFLHLSQPIQDQEREYGTIYLRLSTAGLNQKIARYLITMISLFGALVVLSFFLATQLQRLISRPLIELAEATQKVSDERDYSIRVRSDSSDEVGVLFRGFNRMLSQIQQRKEERDFAEQALRDSEYRYRVLVECSPEAIFLEQDGKIVYVNPAALDLTGYSSASELDTMNLSSLFRESVLSDERAGTLPEETVVIRKDGTLVDAEVLSVKTTHDGRPATQFLIRDVTESKSLRQAAQRMERLAALGEFSAMLAHELRNSIGSVALNVRLLSERLEVPEHYRKNLHNMELGIQRTQEIIKAILDFGRPAPPKLQKVNVNKLIESSLHLVEQDLEQSGIVVERQYDSSEPQVEVDVNQISQVLMNLFLNAKQAMEHGGTITVKTSKRQDGVIVLVGDTGKGIVSENLKKIFDPFFTTTPEGVGLGLAFVFAHPGTTQCSNLCAKYSRARDTVYDSVSEIWEEVMDKSVKQKYIKKNILLVEDDELFRQAMNDYLSEQYTIQEADSGETALILLNKQIPDLLLLDINLPGQGGIDVLKIVRKRWPELPVIMLTAIDRIQKVVECIKLGATDYIAKPIIVEELLASLERAWVSLELRKGLEQRKVLQLAENKEFKLLGNSAALEKVRKQIQLAGKSDSPVLITGETGTGKELAAREIHGFSSRAREPFVAINCGAIPKDLFETEFFGHKKGAFTGAGDSEIGKLQLAHHGTLLLDEISEMPLEAQTKLLRILEEHDFYPVGSTQLIHVDTRVIACTNRNLEEMVKQKLFREDLFFRLNVFTIHIPPLREHPEDIPLLTEHFMQHFNRKFGKRFRAMTDQANESMAKHPWKGNVRELRNILERTILSEDGEIIEKEHLFGANSLSSPEYSENSFQLPPEGTDLEKLEKDLIQQALRMSNGNKTKAAKLLNLSAPTLYYRLEKYGLT